MPSYVDKLSRDEHAVIDGYLDLLVLDKGIRGIVGPNGKTAWTSTLYPTAFGRRDPHCR